MVSFISCLSATKPPSTPHVLLTNNFCPPNRLVSVANPLSKSITSSSLQTPKHKKVPQICSVIASSPSHSEVSPLCFSLVDLLDAVDVESDYNSSSEEEEEENMMKIWTATELEEGVELEINMPGFGKEDVKVTLEETTLMIKGKAPENEKHDFVNGDNNDNLNTDHDENNIMNSISFELDVDFLEINEMKAEMKNGVLKIFIPKVIQEKKEKLVLEVQVE